MAARVHSLWRFGRIASFSPACGKTPDSGPHGLAADKDGNIWFTASFKGYIGKLDPETGTITEYHLPDPAARDPHTPVFDRR
jgi:virginiamycin B lyase